MISEHRLDMESRIGPPQSEEFSFIKVMWKGLLLLTHQRLGFLYDFMNCENMVLHSLAVSYRFLSLNSLALTRLQ